MLEQLGPSVLLGMAAVGALLLMLAYGSSRRARRAMLASSGPSPSQQLFGGAPQADASHRHARGSVPPPVQASSSARMPAAQRPRRQRRPSGIRPSHSRR